MPGDDRVFELRNYVANPGKRDALERRFREHTCALFARHGITVEGFWLPADGDERGLTYLCSYPDRAAAKASWAAFQADPDWIEAKRASEVDGALAEKVESTYLIPTDFSPMR